MRVEAGLCPYPVIGEVNAISALCKEEARLVHSPRALPFCCPVRILELATEIPIVGQMLSLSPRLFPLHSVQYTIAR